MSEKRRDTKNRILRTGESQRKDGRYVYKYIDAHGKQKFVYAWTLVPTDRVPVGKRSNLCLRDKEKIIHQELTNGMHHNMQNMTVCDLYQTYIRYKGNVRDKTKVGRQQFHKILSADSLGTYRIRDVKPSDAKEWVLRMKAKDYGYQTIANYNRSLKAVFYMAIQDDVIAKNPFDFRISDVLEDDRTPKEPLTPVAETAFLSFLKNDTVYQKYYDDVVILLGTGLRISEFCGLTIHDIDMDNKLIMVHHQLNKTASHSYELAELKTEHSKRCIPMSSTVYQALTCVIQRHHINNYRQQTFLFLNRKGHPRTGADYAALFQRIRKKYQKNNANIPLPFPFTPHSLRHTFCTKLAYTGMNPKALQYIMGHKNITMTLNYYAHSNAHMAVNDMRQHIDQNFTTQHTTFEH